MIIQLHELHDDPENARRDPPTEEAVASMAASLGALGQLQPIVIRERPGGPTPTDELSEEEFDALVERDAQEIIDDNAPERACRVCGCTDADCSQCVEKTGVPCHWIEVDLCSACASSVVETDPPTLEVTVRPKPKLVPGRPVGLDPDDEPPKPPSAPGKRTRKRTSTNATAKAA